MSAVEKIHELYKIAFKKDRISLLGRWYNNVIVNDRNYVKGFIFNPWSDGKMMGHDGTSSDININKPIPDEFNINSETAFTITFL